MKVSIARVVPWAVLGVGLATTLVLDQSIGRATEARRTKEYHAEVARIADAVDAAFARQVAVLHATAGAIAIDPKMDRRRFGVFYRELRLGKDAAIPEAIGLSLWRAWDRRDELAAEARARGVEGFQFRPSIPRPEAHAVVLIEPLDGRNDRAPGFDMNADPARRGAIDRARRSGHATMTDRVDLAKDGGAKIASEVLFLPVGDSTDRKPFGVVFSGIHADRLLGSLFRPGGNASGEHVGVRLWSGPKNGANLIYDRPLQEKAVRFGTARFRLPSVGGALEAEISTSSLFGSQGTVRPWVLPVGTAVSLLLLLLATGLRRAHEATERREAEQTLLADVGRLTMRRTDSDDVLQEIASATSATLAAVCRIDLLEPDGSLRTFDTRKEREIAARLSLEGDLPRQENDALFRKALQTGETQRAERYVAVDERHRSLIEAMDAGPVLVVPLWSGDRSLGALTLVRARKAAGFSPEAVALAEAIAGRMALAIDNARLYRDLERRVEERTCELEASNHELESFCYSVSHDLRTPLRSLDGFGRALREDYEDRLDDQGLDYIDRILAATKRMDELITALLTLSRLTRREIVPMRVDVTALVRDQMRDLDPEGRIDLEIEDGLWAYADPRMLAVLFDNLLANAVKFTSRTERPRIAVGKSSGGLIFVRDNGAGFDMAYANKLFKPFERLHSVREFPGHGIGLATVERIVRRHGGEVYADGSPGAGATFSFCFPE